MSDKAHKIAASIAFVAVALITAALAPNGPAQGHPDATMWLQFALAAISALGLTALKPLVGGTSKPDDPSSKLTAFVPLALFVALSSGCAGWASFSKCMKDQAPKDGRALIAAVISYATSQNYLSALLELGKEVGPGTVDCIALALIEDAKGNPKLAKLTDALEHLDAYLKARASAGADLDAAHCAPMVVSTQPVGDHRLDWMSDGPVLAIAVGNPCPVARVAEIGCAGSEAVWRVDVPANGEVRALGRVMNRDAWADPCFVR